MYYCFVFKSSSHKWHRTSLLTKSALGQVMASCHQTTSHYLNQNHLSSMTPYSITRAWLIEAEWCIYVSVKWTIIGSDNGLSPVQWQTIIWTNADSLSIIPLRTIFNETFNWNFNIFIKKNAFLKWGSFCFSLNVLTSDLKSTTMKTWKYITLLTLCEVTPQSVASLYIVTNSEKDRRGFHSHLNTIIWPAKNFLLTKKPTISTCFIAGRMYLFSPGGGWISWTNKQAIFIWSRGVFHYECRDDVEIVSLDKNTGWIFFVIHY